MNDIFIKGEKVTNENLFQLDWAYKDRQRFLRKANAMPVRVKKVKEVAPGVIATNLIGVDVSGADPRSVKAMLRSNGDSRAAKWKAFDFVMSKLNPSSTVEARMELYSHIRAENYMRQLSIKAHWAALKGMVLPRWMLRRSKLVV